MRIAAYVIAALAIAAGLFVVAGGFIAAGAVLVAVIAALAGWSFKTVNRH